MVYKYFKNTSYTETSLKKEYRNLAQIYHPDKGGRASLFKEMDEEYRVLLRQVQNSPIQSKTPEESKKNENNYQYKKSTPHQEQWFHKNKFIRYDKSKTKKQIKPIFLFKKYFQNKIFYRIIFVITSTLWLPAAIHLDVPLFVIVIFYSIPLIFALYTRIHTFAWFMNLLLSGFVIAKLQLTFMIPYFNFWFFFLMFYGIAYAIITMPYQQAYTREQWNDLWRKFKDNFL